MSEEQMVAGQFDTVALIMSSGIGLVFLVFLLVLLVSMWKVFTKAGQPGWAILVPIYNIITMLNICGRPWWWLFLLCIPFVNFIISILVNLDLARNFGKSTLFGIGLVVFPFIFVPMLAFGDARYAPTNP